jgi:threonylcarbamoyladenosine tRNA methylthiotransferase MtaB
MKVYLDTVGCRLNQAEIEMMARRFRSAGHEIVATAQNADFTVVNTCSVTSRAASDSRSKIRRLARAGRGEIIATGCWATLQPLQAAALPHVSQVVPNERKDHLVRDVLRIPEQVFELEPVSREPLLGARRRTRAFIKAQDGCNARCAFCVATVARGKSRSRPVAEMLGEVHAALDGGAKEMVRTGVHLGAWGEERGSHLASLVQAMLRQTDVPRLRLSSLEPWDLNDRFLRLWEDARLCRHLHLPLQSGSAATLKRMRRRTMPASFRELMVEVRAAVPEAAITTDMIAGFPGETAHEFQESLEFAAEMKFAGGHAFTFSPRPGTAAESMQDQVSPQVRRRRNASYRRLFDAAADAYRRRQVGHTRAALWESAAQLEGIGWELSGLTDNYVRVKARADQPRWNEIDTVCITEDRSEFLYGIIAK